MSFFESWSIGILIRATSNAAQTFTATARAASSANSVLDRHNALLRTTAQRQAALRAQISATNQVAGVFNTVFKGLGTASGAAIFSGIKGAADLQSAMTSVAVATNLATNRMGAFYNLAFRTSGKTAQSATTIAQELAAAASSGLSDPRQLMSAFPRIAKAADVMWLSPKHLDPVESVKQMATLSHLFGAYSGAPLQHMLDRATQMMFVQPEGLQQLITQGRQFIGPALARGVSEDDIFKMSMTMGQTGFLRSRGGSALARVVEYLGGAATATGHLSTAQHAAMRALGLTDSSGHLSHQYIDGKGDLLLGKVVDHLEHIRKNFAPMQFGNLLTNAFEAQGGRFMATILLPSVYNQVQRNWSQMNAIGNVDTLWKKYTQTFLYQWSVFATNFQNVSKAIFLPLLPQLTSLLQKWGTSLQQDVVYLNAHPKTAKAIGQGLFVAFGASLAGIVTTSLVAAANVWRLNAAIVALSVSSRAGLTGAGVSSAAGAGVGGLIAKIASRLKAMIGLGSPLATTGGVYAEVSALVERGLIARIIGGIGGVVTRGIPVVGWLLTIVTGINGVASLIRNSPTIVTAVHNWWVHNQYGIGYTIGKAFGTIGKMLQSAISGLIAVAWAGIQTTVSNVWELATIGGRVALAHQVAKAQEQTAKQWLAAPGSQSFGSGFTSGFSSAFNAPAPVHIDLSGATFNLQAPLPTDSSPLNHPTPGQMFDELLRQAQAAGKAHGVHTPISPYLSPFPGYQH